MNDTYMGRQCKYAKECHLYRGTVQMKQPLFIVRNIYCNNGFRWWSRCKIYIKLEAGEDVEKTMIPSESLRL